MKLFRNSIYYIFKELSAKYNLRCASCNRKFISPSEHHRHLIRDHRSKPIPLKAENIVSQAEQSIERMGFKLGCGSNYYGIHPDGTRIKIIRKIDSTDGTVEDAVRMIFNAGNIKGKYLYL